MFDQIFTSKTASATLNQALKRIDQKKSKLLLILERPDIPLHNNGAESAIRENVKNGKLVALPAVKPAVGVEIRSQA